MAASIDHIATNPRVSRVNNEPLQRFIDAKKYVTEIYNDIGTHIDELAAFYVELEKDNQKFVPLDQVKEAEGLKDTINSIKEMIGRDKMKVVFFGRTSNGKSTVINSMLHSRILPQGLGHTTCCFLQVEGGSESDKHFVMEGSQERQPLSELDTVGHALTAGNELTASLGKNSLIRVLYPRSSSKLLQNDVVIVDSPGVDLSPESDSWIDKHCMDADVFVLVSNSESTLTQVEKNFFDRVRKKLSRPNIFILCNRWDASDEETEHNKERIKAQHRARFVQFLVNEMKVCSQGEAENRFFFISALEMLEYRLSLKGLLPAHHPGGGFQRRSVDFERFEKNFEKSISKSAIHTKFEAHSHRARDILISMKHNLDCVYNAAMHEKHRLALEYQLKGKEYAKCVENFNNFERIYRREQKKTQADVSLKVSADFADEISRLEAIFDRFSYNFSDDPNLIDEYKQELAKYVDQAVGTDLENQCTGGLMARIWTLEINMNNYVKEMLGGSYETELDKLWRYKQPFKFAITVNCQKMVEDFHEDLEFRFSLGVENIARWILSTTRGQPITAIDRNILGRGRKWGHNDQLTLQKQEVDVFLSNLLVSSASYLVNGSVGVAIFGLIIYKNIDWRWIAGGAGLIGGLYTYERWKWNTGAKEERLKKQLRSHLEQRLRQMESIHTSQCEVQVTNELHQVYEGLCNVIAGAQNKMREHIDSAKMGIGKVDEVVKNISTMKNKFDFVYSTLESFAAKFLNPSQAKLYSE